MESLFQREPVARPLTIYERLAPEIEHLQKAASTRYKAKPGRVMSWVFILAVASLLGLFFMDPFLYALHRSEAIRAYLYLHSYDTDATVQPLVASRILSKNEIGELDKKDGSFQNYFSSRQAAEAAAAGIVNYMNGLQLLRSGAYENLDPIGKLRYFLFVRSGIIPPVSWSSLNPSVGY